jgi:hypothetical protein
MMRKLLILLACLACSILPAQAYVSVNIGINVPAYPTLQRVPGYPVYYAPRLRANYFFYDGLYWVYVPDGWYASPWYDGPWELVAVDSVPLFVLRVPVRYYGAPPVTFRQWRRDTPPRWDAVWGQDWSRRHHDWDRWNRHAAPAPAPLPSYQRRYAGGSYPDDARRRELVQQHYRYAPRDEQVRQQWQSHLGDTATRPQARPNPPQAAPAPTQQARARDARSRDMRYAEREHAPRTDPAPPQRPPVAPPAPPRLQAPAPPTTPAPMQGRAEERAPGQHGRPEHGRPEHGGRPDKGERGDKGDDHEPGRHR